MACPNSRTFSVMVVLPASGCEMIAKVRLLETSLRNSADIIRRSSIERRPGATVGINAGQHLGIRAPMQTTTPRRRVMEPAGGKRRSAALHGPSRLSQSKIARHYTRASEKYPARHEGLKGGSGSGRLHHPVAPRQLGGVHGL